MKEELSMERRVLFLCKFFGVVLSVLVIGLTLFMIPVLWKIPIHNIKLSAFQRNFANISHPKGTTFIAELKDFGLFGNSDASRG